MTLLFFLLARGVKFLALEMHASVYPTFQAVKFFGGRSQQKKHPKRAIAHTGPPCSTPPMLVLDPYTEKECKDKPDFLVEPRPQNPCAQSSNTKRLIILLVLRGINCLLRCNTNFPKQKGRKSNNGRLTSSLLLSASKKHFLA